MRYASVCSGVEAASLAWEYLGWKPVWFSEIEPFPSAVLKERFPKVPNLGDMTKIKGDDYNGAVDLLVGGTPCQGFSIAGRRGGLNDERSCLCLSYVRLLKEMRPRWFVWENVPGVFGTNRGGISKPSLERLMSAGIAVHGECWTLNMCEWTASLVPYLKEGGVCSLSDILEPTGVIPQRFYLSSKACLGVIRRAEARNIEIAEPLRTSLNIGAMTIKPTQENQRTPEIYAAHCNRILERVETQNQ